MQEKGSCIKKYCVAKYQIQKELCLGFVEDTNPGIGVCYFSPLHKNGSPCLWILFIPAFVWNAILNWNDLPVAGAHPDR